MTSLKLKRVNEQVIVITGASSGIGLETAEMAARRGACLVLAARSEGALNAIADRIIAQGGQAIVVACDVAQRAQVEKVAAAAAQKFGRIDTWVNNAGQGLYGKIEEVSEEDNRRHFDVNFWGVVNGSLAALPYLRKDGGALITLGSEVSEAYIPLLGMYTASKHAVKGFIDSLRVELALEGAPVSVTLVQPTAVDTPFPQHARNYQDQEPKLPVTPIDPSKVAEVILHAAEYPTRSARVGLLAKLNTTMATFMPAFADKMAGRMVDRQHYNEAPRAPAGVLNQPSEATGVVGQSHGTGGVQS